jgi:hypothetical protein
MVTTLPYVLVAVAAKLLLERVVEVKGYLDFGDVGAVLTAGAFLIGFMLAGTMSDYKESEKLPGELATALEGMEDAISLASIKSGFDAAGAKKKLMALTEGVRTWLARKAPVDSVHALVGELMPSFQEMDKAGATAHAARGATEAHNLRKTVTRIEVIAKTGFLSSGYAVLEFMVASIVVLLVLSRFKSQVAEYTLISFITLVYVYLLRLIKDVDDPFEYSENGTQGAAEVDLFPLEQYAARLRSRIG